MDYVFPGKFCGTEGVPRLWHFAALTAALTYYEGRKKLGVIYQTP